MHGCNAWNMRHGCRQRCKHKQTKAYVCMDFSGDAAKAVFYTQASSGMRIEVYEPYYACSCLLVLTVICVNICISLRTSVRGIKDTRAIFVIASHRSSTAQYIYLFFVRKRGQRWQR